MKSSFIKYYICIAFTICLSHCYGQIEESGLTQDSTLLDDQLYYADSSKKNENGFFSMFEGEPGKAALYSALIPGGGQIYNKKWLKAPIVWGLEGTAIGMIAYYGSLHKDVDLGYKGMVRGEITSYRGYTDPAGLKQLRDKLKKFRDYSIIGLAAAHVLGIADAFVDRHLMEFDVDEDISFEFGPTQHGVGFSFVF